MDPKVFDCTWLVKTELENILTKVCHQPATLGTLTPIELTVLIAKFSFHFLFYPKSLITTRY